MEQDRPIGILRKGVKTREEAESREAENKETESRETGSREAENKSVGSNRTEGKAVESKTIEVKTAEAKDRDIVQFADGLPEWDILPPHVVVRRMKRV